MGNKRNCSIFRMLKKSFTTVILRPRSGRRIFNAVIVFPILFLVSGLALAEEQELKELKVESLQLPTGQANAIIESIAIEIEQASGQLVPEAASSTMPGERSGRGLSILRVNSGRADELTAGNMGMPAHLPKTAAEAKQAGWKTKTVKTPEPIEKLVKEVPEEVKAKRARKKAKLERQAAERNKTK